MADAATHLGEQSAAQSDIGVVEVAAGGNGEQLQVDRQGLELLFGKFRNFRRAAGRRLGAGALPGQAQLTRMQRRSQSHVVESGTRGLGAQVRYVGLQRELADHPLAGLRVGHPVGAAGDSVGVVHLGFGDGQQGVFVDRFEQAHARQTRCTAGLEDDAVRQPPVARVEYPEAGLAQAVGLAVGKAARHLLPVDDA